MTTRRFIQWFVVSPVKILAFSQPSKNIISNILLFLSDITWSYSSQNERSISSKWQLIFFLNSLLVFLVPVTPGNSKELKIESDVRKTTFHVRITFCERHTLVWWAKHVELFEQKIILISKGLSGYSHHSVLTW